MSGSKRISVLLFPDRDDVWHFLYSPREPRRWDYTIRSTEPLLDGRTGSFTATLPAAGQPPAPRYPNWWTDDPALAERGQQGVRTVSRWREN